MFIFVYLKVSGMDSFPTQKYQSHIMGNQIFLDLVNKYNLSNLNFPQVPKNIFFQLAKLAYSKTLEFMNLDFSTLLLQCANSPPLEIVTNSLEMMLEIHGWESNCGDSLQELGNKNTKSMYFNHITP